MQSNPLSITTKDGYEIKATVYQPQNENKSVFLINSANAVKQGYYSSFATYLAELGYWVYTYGYRGIGESKPAKI